MLMLVFSDTALVSIDYGHSSGSTKRQEAGNSIHACVEQPRSRRPAQNDGTASGTGNIENRRWMRAYKKAR